MAQKSGTIPTGRPSIFSASSSASTPSVLSSPRRRKPSHATIRHRRSRSTPFKLSLNLVLKVQPLNSDREQRFSLNESFGPDEVFYSESSGIAPNNVQQQQGEYHPYPIYLPTSTSTSERSVAKSSASRSSHSRSSQDSSLKKEKVHKTRKVSSSKKPLTKSLGTSVRFRDSSPLRSSSNGSVTRVSGAESSASRSSQGSLKDKRKVHTTGNRKNKQSLYSSSLEKPRSKSLTAIPGFQPYPRPRRLSFNVSDALGEAAVANETITSDADKTFPLDKSFSNSLGLDDTLPVARRLTFNEANEPHEVGDVAVKSSESRTSRSSHDSTKDKKNTPGSPYKNRRSSLKKPRTSLGFVGIPPSRSSSNGSVTNVSGAESSASRSSQGSLKKVRSSGNRYENKQSLLTFSSLKKPRSKSLGTSSKLELPHAFSSNAQVFGAKSSNSAIGLNDNIRSSLGLNTSVVSANLDATGSKSSQIFNHQRSVRIGFIANNIPMAVNCLVNIRSDQKILHVEPVELLYEGFKIWRRSVREVQKEIDGKLAADKKK